MTGGAGRWPTGSRAAVVTAGAARRRRSRWSDRRLHGRCRGLPAAARTSTSSLDDMAGVGPRDPLDHGRHPARHRRHAHPDRHRARDHGAARHRHRGLHDRGRRRGSPGVVRTVVEAMTALPSIVAGPVHLHRLILALGFPRSGLAAALALGVMMLPIIARAADVVLRRRARRPARGVLRPRRSRWQHGLARRAADRAARPGDRADPRRRPRRRRDRRRCCSPRAPRRSSCVNPTERRDELAAALHLLRRPQRRAAGRSSAPSPPPRSC